MRGLPDPPILLITDRVRARRLLAAVLEDAFAAGCRWASLREKDLTPAARLDLLRALLPAARRHGAVLTVHGDLGSGGLCDGVHLPGGGDVPAARAMLAGSATPSPPPSSRGGEGVMRRSPDASGPVPDGGGPTVPSLSPPGRGQERGWSRPFVGLSCHTLDDVRRAAEAGADYVTLSPVFLTDSKPGYGPALGPGIITEAERFGLPVLALGGVTPQNAAVCRAAGAAGIAVMGGVMGADDPGAAMAVLIRAWEG